MSAPPSLSDRAIMIAAVRDAARAEIMPRFRTLAAGDVRSKGDPSDLVTVADIAAEARIAHDIGAALPGLLVVGEEAVAADPALRPSLASAARVVIVDPVDGTWNFAKGLAVFGVILAVAEGGQPQFGMLYDPVMDDWVEAGPGATWFVTADGSRVPLTTSAETLPERMTGYVPTGLFNADHRMALATALADVRRVHSLRCSCHEYRMLAQGHAEFCLSGPTPHPWDHAAGVLAVQGAGGVARFLDGAPYDTARETGILLSASSETVWREIAQRLDFLA
ncbi:MAG: inositol monophosphatase [Limimaricola sp.]|uniref:inositol monophosphatase family protein n=1 Tax=Limimaricola sp. TaxID=2211665 RepID=UPI001D3CD0FC|nr:inositol monophosphatase [Limimaricola sp.]MBI1415941.1 inositol monophosphatase [Limimaricola sp.]